jgi:cytochrome c553
MKATRLHIAFLPGLALALALAPAAGHAQSADSAVPAWLFPSNPPATPGAPPPDGEQLRHLPGSSAGYTDAQLADLFVAPDWRPRSHDAMPLPVAIGRAPDVFACGYCHTPGGQGRPENAALAGLPVGYMLQQVADFQSGERRHALPGPWRPGDFMIQVARHATAKEIQAAARYFSRQQLGPRVRVVEAERVPSPRVVGLIYTAAPAGGEEPLGQRLLEYAPDARRHELRDDQLVYVAYVPPGSVGRGHALATVGVGGLPTACVTCHGPQLRGVGLVPPLAGRSPSSLLRQLVGFKNGARHGATAVPMQPVVAAMDIGMMIDAVAYAASLQP